MKTYKIQELLTKVEKLPSFKAIPDNYWILGIQSQEDKFNQFDDVFFLFLDRKLIFTLTGTTNAGITGLQNYTSYTKSGGCAIVKTEEWYYDLWKHGLHKGKLKALVQNQPIKFFRDWNKNTKAEEIGKMYIGTIGVNFHASTYKYKTNWITKLIGGWSVACQVSNNVDEYYKLLSLVSTQKTISYCLIKEY